MFYMSKNRFGKPYFFKKTLQNTSSGKYVRMGYCVIFFPSIFETEINYWKICKRHIMAMLALFGFCGLMPNFIGRIVSGGEIVFSGAA